MFPGLPTASLTISDLFSSPFHFTVPPYQRPYSWTTAEAGQLLDDVLAAAGIGGNPATPEPDYFLGTIILIDEGGGTLPKGREREPRSFEIVDGQQRLVTLAMLMAVLRDLGTERWRWGGRNRLDQLIAADSAATRLYGMRYRIELRAQERAFLESHVQARGACVSTPPEAQSLAEERLLAVREHFRSELSALDESDRRRLSDYVCELCHVVVVLARDIDRAHQLFTVLNERGRALQRNDILKAELLKGIAPERVDAALERWDGACQALGASFETFFSHLFSIYGRGESKIIAGLRRTIGQVGGPEPFLDGVLTPLADAYRRVLHAADVEMAIDPEARRYLVYLGRLAEGDWAPAAMLALRAYDEDPQRGVMLLKEIDRLAHLLRLLCYGTNKRKRRFAEVVDLIKSGAPIKTSEPPFRLSREEIRNVGYHLRSPYKRDQHVCKLLLLRLSDEMTRTTTLLNPSDYSVEHVLPQRPAATSEWRRWFPDAEEREICTESLGNLIVVTQKQNDRARNQEFARKREVYRGSDDTPVLPVTRDAVEASVWRASEIHAREAKLLGLVRDIWGVEVTSVLAARSERNSLALRSDVA